MSKRVATKRELKTFFDAVADIPYPNSGGCLFFCYVFWLWLKKKGYDRSSFTINQYDYNETVIKRNIAFIEKKQKNAGSSNHFTWSYNGQEYDAEGIPSYTPGHRHVFKLRCVKRFCENALINGSWNHMFDRNAAIKEVGTKLRISLPKSIKQKA